MDDDWVKYGALSADLNFPEYNEKLYLLYVLLNALSLYWPVVGNSEGNELFPHSLSDARQLRA
jgi:hypothetical protein